MRLSSSHQGVRASSPEMNSSNAETVDNYQTESVFQPSISCIFVPIYSSILVVLLSHSRLALIFSRDPQDYITSRPPINHGTNFCLRRNCYTPKVKYSPSIQLLHRLASDNSAAPGKKTRECPASVFLSPSPFLPLETLLVNQCRVSKEMCTS